MPTSGCNAWGRGRTALGRRPAFDALALTFARLFEKSPPAWIAPADDGSTARETTGGRAHVSLSGVLSAAVGEVLKQTMKLAATSNMVRMDVAKLTDADNNGATLLMRALAALKRAKKELVFGSPEHLAGILAAKLVPGERSNEAMWLLLLELYQQAFRQDAFEEAAVNYAVTFEVSPPSWEARPSRWWVARASRWRSTACASRVTTPATAPMAMPA